MLRFIIEHTVFSEAMIVCSMVGIISFAIMEISYINMTRATTKIGKTKKKWLVSLKQKYEDYHNMNIKVNNVSTFVNRLFRRKKILGLPMSFWQTVERISIAGCAIVGAAGALVASWNRLPVDVVVTTYLIGVICALCLFVLDIILRSEEKQNIIVTNMNDYLENVLDNSLEGLDTVEDAEEREKRKAKLLRYAKEHPKQKASRLQRKKEETLTPEEGKLLEDVIQEFFA